MRPSLSSSPSFSLHRGQKRPGASLQAGYRIQIRQGEVFGTFVVDPKSFSSDAASALLSDPDSIQHAFNQDTVLDFIRLKILTADYPNFGI